MPLLLALPAAAADSSWEMNIRTLPSDEAAPAQGAFSASAPVRELAEGYLQAYRPSEKQARLEQLGKTAPQNSEDIRWLLHLYRNGTTAERIKVEESLARISPARQEFAPYFVSLIQESDPADQGFGSYGAFWLRAPEALPLFHKIVSGRFPAEEPDPLEKPVEASRWNLQYQTLEFLAAWEGPKVFGLLLKKSKEVPKVASLMASQLWEQTLPEILSWSESSSQINVARAKFAWLAPVRLEKLRATLPLLRQTTLDPKKKLETRHQAAIKLGQAADDAEVDSLLKEYQDSKDPQTRLILSVALFASRNPKAVPLLVDYAKTNPSPVHRAGALVQLGEMLPPQDFRSLLHWVAEHDSDSENRNYAQRTLQSLKE